MDKAKLETEIIKIASEIFLLIQEKSDESSEFLTLRTKLTDMIWRWAECIFTSSQLENAGVEITKCIKRCILNCQGKPDKFIHYLFVATQQEIKRANIKLSIDEKNIIHIPEKKERILRRLIAYAQSYGKNIYESNTQQWLSKAVGYSIEEIRQFVEYKILIDVKSEYTINNDNEEISLFDNEKTCSKYDKEGTFKFLNSECIKQNIHIRIKNLDETFAKEKANTQNQKLSRKYLGALLTRQILQELEVSKYYEFQDIVSLIKKTHFCNESILQSFENGTLPTQQEVSKIFGKDKTDASRKIKQFIEKYMKSDQLQITENLYE